MTSPPSTDERRRLIWAHVYRQLLQHAIPDSRFHYDFLSFTPDFRGSSSAIDRVASLPCYTSAQTILISPDNSLEQLRHRALKDGKKVIVATYRLRRGFILLDPTRIRDTNLPLAACLDGMERLGRPMTLAQLRDETLKINLCVTGGLAFNPQGVTIWEGASLFEVQWALLQDMHLLIPQTPVVALAHACQVVDEAILGLDSILAENPGEVQCDFVVTPERTITVLGAVKAACGVDFQAVHRDAVASIPPLQELKGIRMMEQIMQREGFGEGKEGKGKVKEGEKEGEGETEKDRGKEKEKTTSAEEQMGISIVEKLMKGYKF